MAMPTSEAMIGCCQLWMMVDGVCGSGVVDGPIEGLAGVR